MLSSRSLYVLLFLSPSLFFFFFFLPFSLLRVVSLFHCILSGSFCSSCRARVNVQAHGVTEISHTRSLRTRSTVTPPRLYLVSNCSFSFNDARRSTCRLQLCARARTRMAPTTNFRGVAQRFTLADLRQFRRGLARGILMDSRRNVRVPTHTYVILFAGMKTDVQFFASNEYMLYFLVEIGTRASLVIFRAN